MNLKILRRKSLASPLWVLRFVERSALRGGENPTSPLILSGRSHSCQWCRSRHLAGHTPPLRIDDPCPPSGHGI